MLNYLQAFFILILLYLLYRQHQGSSEEETLSIQPPVHIKKHKRHKKTKSKEEKKKKRHKDRSPGNSLLTLKINLNIMNDSWLTLSMQHRLKR